MPARIFRVEDKPLYHLNTEGCCLVDDLSGVCPRDIDRV